MKRLILADRSNSQSIGTRYIGYIRLLNSNNSPNVPRTEKVYCYFTFTLWLWDFRLTSQFSSIFPHQMCWRHEQKETYRTRDVTIPLFNASDSWSGFSKRLKIQLWKKARIITPLLVSQFRILLDLNLDPKLQRSWKLKIRFQIRIQGRTITPLYRNTTSRSKSQKIREITALSALQIASTAPSIKISAIISVHRGVDVVTTRNGDGRF